MATRIPAGRPRLPAVCPHGPSSCMRERNPTTLRIAAPFLSFVMHLPLPARCETEGFGGHLAGGVPDVGRNHGDVSAGGVSDSKENE